MGDAMITAIATGLLVLVGLAQVVILIGQRRQLRLDLAESYRRRWTECRKDWAGLVFIGRASGEFYQVGDRETVKMLERAVEQYDGRSRDAWVSDSVRSVTSMLSDISLRILQGQLHVSDVYPIFGTELLRHSRALRVLLDVEYMHSGYGLCDDPDHVCKHDYLRGHVQEWLIYHDGIRRRCLILIDLLWAEASRLEDLPPPELKSAADAKKLSGKDSRSRLFSEFRRLNGVTAFRRGLQLRSFLRHAEYRQKLSKTGIDPKRLAMLEAKWLDRLLHKQRLTFSGAGKYGR
ncbi:hypothetical protein [Pseudomonas paraversuta]|uniref:hypothetical protein n=1 Tax=Pseudomonas paraversuta TaxID=2750624 RepID=UPI001933CAD6|nr:hypothetical protein [Pseudomonas paraversuta]